MNINPRLESTLNEQAPVHYKNPQSSEPIEEIGLDTMGFDALGSGSGRSVFDMSILGYDNYALKLATPDDQYDGLKQNNREIYLYNNLGSKEQSFLAPIKCWGQNNYWLIMRKGSTPETIGYQWKQDLKYYLRDYVWEEDMRDENIIQVNGEYKLCDYGTPPQ